MIILGIETSCDETAAAVFVDGTRILSSVVSSQIAVHNPYGGVVPELASRKHIEAIVPVVESAIGQAGLAPDGPRRHCRHPGARADRLPAGRIHLCQGLCLCPGHSLGWRQSPGRAHQLGFSRPRPPAVSRLWPCWPPAATPGSITLPPTPRWPSWDRPATMPPAKPTTKWPRCSGWAIRGGA